MEKEIDEDEVEYEVSDLEKKLRENMLNKEKQMQFTPFKLRKDVNWSDIDPIDQFSPEVDILKIDYDDKYKEISSYFRAILHKNELSMRAYNLNTELLEINATNYMAWYHRRQCLDNLTIDLKKELNWLDEFGVVNQKNYQIWHHRKVIIEKLNDPSQEKPFLDQVFSQEFGLSEDLIYSMENLVTLSKCLIRYFN